MSNTLTYILQLQDKMSAPLEKVGVSSDSTKTRVKGLRQETERLNKAPLAGISGAFSGLLRTVAPIMLVTAGVTALTRAVSGSQTAYNAQAVAENQLTTIMRQRIGATDAQIESVMKLASAQQKLGVIGDEVQLAGAQQLTTFLKQKSSIDTLLPAMNNLLAQQRGLNATSTDAVNIGNLMGKVLQGQTAALTRVGITFTEEEERLLKFGNEQQRAAILAQVITNNVGEMNKALAQTPEGALKQNANNLGDIQERIGRLIVVIKASFSPIVGMFISASNKVMDIFERNEGKIKNAISIVSGLFVYSVKTMYNTASWLYDLFVRFRTPILAIVAAIVLYKTSITVLTVVTNLWTAAQWLLNAALTANPIGLIIAGIVALIALITFLIVKIDGWGKTWSNVIEYSKLQFTLFKEATIKEWMVIQDTFLTGIEIIQKGWYKLKSLWDKSAADEGLAALESQRNERANELAKQRGKVEDLQKQIANMKVIELSWNKTAFSDITNKLKNKLGISSPTIPGVGSSIGGGTDGLLGTGDTGVGGAGKDTANSIATGGTKTTHITINISELGNDMKVFVSGVKEGAENIRDMILDELTRALAMAQGQA